MIESRCRSSRNHRADGYSAIELLIVAAMVIAITAIAVFTLAPKKRAHRADDAAAQVTNFFRDAYSRAIAQRQTMRVQINRSTNLMTLIDENRLPVGDETEVRRAKLSDEVSLVPPVVAGAPIGVPPAPYSYGAAVFGGDVWAARFRSDGSVVDGAGNPLSATLFFSPVNMRDSDSNLVRAVTIFGPSGSMRLWRYTGASFDAGAN